MSKRPPRQEGYPWLMPYLIVKDSDAALDFYQRAFGFTKRMAMPGPNGKTMHAELNWHDAVIMIGTPMEERPDFPHKTPAATGVASPIVPYLYCDDVDALYARATAAGAAGLKPPQDMFYGDRVCTLKDPDGYWWNFATNVADFDPSKAP